MYVVDLASSQISVETSTTRRQSHRQQSQSQHTGEGDGLETSVMTVSSISRWQQFVTSVRSATYFCLITCPAGMF